MITQMIIPIVFCFSEYAAKIRIISETCKPLCKKNGLAAASPD